MAHSSWISSSFCFLACYIIIVNISCATAETTAIPSNSSNATTSSYETVVEYVDYYKITSAKRAGVVTIEYDFKPDNETTVDDEVRSVHRRTKEVVVQILTGQDEDLTTAAGTTASEERSTAASRRRRAAAAAASYHVDLVAVDPPVKDGRLRTPVVATDQDGEVLPAAELEHQLHVNQQQITDQTGYTVVRVYVGPPADVLLLAPVDDRPSIWQKHFWMFVVVAILLLVALLTGLLCLICFYCCRNKQTTISDTKHPPPPTLVDTKAPVDEKMELTRAAPVQQSAPPPMKEQPTTTPHHTDDEDGWIVPLDQFSQEELDQPDVQISRL